MNPSPLPPSAADIHTPSAMLPTLACGAFGNFGSVSVVGERKRVLVGDSGSLPDEEILVLAELVCELTVV